MALPIASVVAGSLIDPTTFGNAVVDALNAAPRGRVGFASKTSQQTGITTITDITGLSVTFTAVAGRRYRVRLQSLIFSSVANDIPQIQIRNAANTILNLAQVTSPNTFGMSISCDYVTDSFSGSTTVKASASRSNGTGTVTFDCGALYPAFILVEDIGT